MEKENRQIKSSVFADLFQDCLEAKQNALSLVNALEGTNYTDPDIIHHFRIDDTIYKDSKNDVSFIVGNIMLVLAEHQATINENMPLRCLIYIGRLYEKIIPMRARYKERMVPIPTPEFYVFYNGKDDYPSMKTLRLSDAFISETDSPELEVVVHVININLNKNNDILKKCAILKEYSTFIEIVRKHEALGKKNPYKDAIQECIDKGILADYLRREGHDVETFLQARYDRNLDIEVKLEEAEEAGSSHRIEQYVKKRRAVGLDDREITEELMDIFELSEDEAQTFVSKE